MAGPCNDNPKVNCGQGIPGKDGTAGTQMAIRSTAEPVGVNCPYGGWKVEVGPDPGNTGSPITVLQTFYVCDGIPGASRAIRVTAEAPGAHCAAGGYKVETGDDTDSDGIPDANVVTSYTCNGTNGTPGVSPTLIAGIMTTLGYGAIPTAVVTPMGGNVYRIDLGIPAGQPGAAGGSVSSAITMDIAPPECLEDAIADPASFNDWMAAIGNALCGTVTSPGTFKATKTYDQPIEMGAVAVTLYRTILYEDDNTPGNHDNGNNFFNNIFVAPAGGITKTFVQENFKLKKATSSGWAAGAGGDLHIELVKDDGAITVLATSALINYNTVDALGNDITSISGFSVPALTSGIITLAAGDKVYARAKCSNGTGVTFQYVDILIGSRLSNY